MAGAGRVGVGGGGVVKCMIKNSFTSSVAGLWRSVTCAVVKREIKGCVRIDAVEDKAELS